MKSPIESLPQLMAVCDGKFEALFAMLGEEMDRNHLEMVNLFCFRLLCLLSNNIKTDAIFKTSENGKKGSNSIVLELNCFKVLFIKYCIFICIQRYRAIPAKNVL